MMRFALYVSYLMLPVSLCFLYADSSSTLPLLAESVFVVLISYFLIKHSRAYSAAWTHFLLTYVPTSLIFLFEILKFLILIVCVETEFDR